MNYDQLGKVSLKVEMDIDSIRVERDALLYNMEGELRRYEPSTRIFSSTPTHKMVEEALKEVTRAALHTMNCIKAAYAKKIAAEEKDDSDS